MKNKIESQKETEKSTESGKEDVPKLMVDIIHQIDRKTAYVLMDALINNTEEVMHDLPAIKKAIRYGNYDSILELLHWYTDRDSAEAVKLKSELAIFK